MYTGSVKGSGRGSIGVIDLMAWPLAGEVLGPT